MSVCGTATGRECSRSRDLLGAASAPGAKRRHRDGRRLDRRLAKRAHLPERLERRLARRAGLFQLRGADRADEEAHVDLAAAHRAMEVALRQPVLHRLDLELALAYVFEVRERELEIK